MEGKEDTYGRRLPTGNRALVDQVEGPTTAGADDQADEAMAAGAGAAWMLANVTRLGFSTCGAAHPYCCSKCVFAN